MTTGIENRACLLAGGLGARCAPSGEREGRSPLAFVYVACKRRLRGAREAETARRYRKPQA